MIKEQRLCCVPDKLPIMEKPRYHYFSVFVLIGFLSDFNVILHYFLFQRSVSGLELSKPEPDPEPEPIQETQRTTHSMPVMKYRQQGRPNTDAQLNVPAKPTISALNGGQVPRSIQTIMPRVSGSSGKY